MPSHTENYVRERADLDQRMAILVDHFSRCGCTMLDMLIVKCGQVSTREQLSDWLHRCDGECCSGITESIMSLAQLAGREIRARVMERQLDALRSKQL